MFLAHRRATAHVPVVLDLLQWRLRQPGRAAGRRARRLPAHARPAGQATQLRHPVVGGLARRVRYTLLRRAADRRRARPRPGRRCATSWTGCRHRPIRPERAARIDEHRRGRRADPRRVRRAAPRRDARGDDAALLPHPHPARAAGRRPRRAPAAHRGLRPHDGQRYIVLATTVHTDRTRRPRATRSAVQGDLRRMIAQLPAEPHRAARPVRHRRARPRTPTRSGPRRRSARCSGGCRSSWSGSRSRCAGPQGDERSAWFTFRPGPDRRPVEDRTLRGLHPMVAERLGLWRLADFELTRLPSPVDVHLFRAVGRNVPDDQRLIVLSDVRDLTVLARRGTAASPRRPAPAGAGARLLPGRAARGPRRRPRRRAAGLEPGAALRLAGGGPAAGGAGHGRAGAGAAHRGAGPGAGGRASSAHVRATGTASRTEGAAAAAVPAAGRRADGAGHRAAHRAAARAGRLRAEGDPGPPPRRGVPVRAGPDAAAQPGPRAARPARSPSTTSTPDGAPVPRRAPDGAEHGQHRAGHGQHADRALPGGHDAAWC